MEANVSEAMRMVIEFHRAFGLPMEGYPGNISDELRNLRVRLLKEEVSEFSAAAYGGDLTEVAKELSDIMVIVYGTALSYGIDLDAVFRLVHQSNMSKLDSNGNPILRADGKVLKSELYQEPHIDLVNQLPLPLNRHRDCRDCNYDTHRCQGCGEPIPHGTVGCDDCLNRCHGCGDPIPSGALGCRDCMMGGHGG